MKFQVAEWKFRNVISGPFAKFRLRDLKFPFRALIEVAEWKFQVAESFLGLAISDPSGSLFLHLVSNGV